MDKVCLLTCLRFKGRNIDCNNNISVKKGIYLFFRAPELWRIYWYTGMEINLDTSLHTSNWKNHFLVLRKGSTYGINGSNGEKKFFVKFIKANAKFYLSSNYNGEDS